MTQKTLSISAPEAVIYTKLKLPSDIPTGVSLSDELSKLISLEVQGVPVEVSEEYPTPILMAAFDVAHKVSPEMVLRLKDDRRVLLFDHWGIEVLRDKDIEVIEEPPEHKQSKRFSRELIINLGDIWEKTESKEDVLKAIKNVLREVDVLIKPAEITTLIGKAPTLLFLLVQHTLYGLTREIWYQENAAQKPVRITQL